MLKIIKLLSIFALFTSIFLLSPKNILAQCACDCICVENGTEVGSCSCDSPSCSRGSPSLTSWGPSCTSATPRPGGGGGGGGGNVCWDGRVNCPPNAKVSYGQLISRTTDYNWYTSSKMCRPLGSAQLEVDGYINTYNCCNAGTKDTCTTVYSDYTITNTNPFCLPNVEISRVPLPCYLTTNDKGHWVTICPIQVTCRQPVTTCTCVSDCNPTAPTIVTNPTPANGSTITTATQVLTWLAPSSWGTGCPSNNQTYQVYFGKDSPSNMTRVETVTSTSSSPYTNLVNGSTYYWAIYPNNGSLSAANPTVWSFTVNVPPAITTPWWQVKDGDVTASNGDILSHVPATYTFNLNGTGGFPGVPVYSGQLIYDTGILSSKNWSANTTTTQGRIFDYTYFKNLIPDSVVPTTNSALLTSAGFVQDGYEWFKITGDLSLNDIDFGNRKVILFVDNGNLTLNGKVNVTDGTGFFGVFVKGNILVKSTVTGAAALEGIYLSDGSFTSELAATQLHVRGSVASYGGVALQRNLADDSTAAELFEYAPDQILLFPKKLAYRRTKWAEIAP